MHAERLTGQVDETHGHINPLAARNARKVQDRRLRQQAIRDFAAHAYLLVGRFEQRVPERSSVLVRELHGVTPHPNRSSCPLTPLVTREQVSTEYPALTYLVLILR